MSKILVVDDQKNLRMTLAYMLRTHGHEVDEAESGEAALQRAQSEAYDLVLTDLRMEPVDGMKVLEGVRRTSSGTQVIVMTAFGSIESAVKAMQLGAADYITKPFNHDEIVLRIDRALQHSRLESEVSILRGEFRDRYKFENIIGSSRALRDVLNRVARVAPTDTTVLIMAESGSGKELIAKAIHANSKRADKAFVPVNCAAIPEQLMESELFGHAKGAFTGAVGARKGLFEEADGGTFFFDEVTELAPSMQAKLLRALQEHEIRRVGDNKAVKVDVRILAATNVNIEQAVEKGAFREDLYYRLNVVPVHIPPLRERREDIPLLVEHFLAQHNRDMGRQVKIGREVMSRLVQYDFPGNVRELENMVEQIVALSGDGEDVTPEAVMMRKPLRSGAATHDQTGASTLTLEQAVAETERARIAGAIEGHRGDMAAVAKELGLSATTLWRKMKKYGLRTN